MESHIQLMVADIVHQVQDRDGEPFDPHRLITGSTMAVLWRVLFGYNVDSFDPQLIQVMHWMEALSRRRKYAVIADLFPLLRFLPKIRRELSASNEAQKKLLTHLSELIEKNVVDRHDASFVGCFRETEGPGFGGDELLYVLHDLVCVGTEMISATLKWAVLLLANHPDVQRRCQEQIDAVVAPPRRLPSLDDRPSLPYVEAAILEIMRCKTVIPMSVPRETLRDTVLAGHLIPAGTMVKFVLFHSIMVIPSVL